MKPVISHITGRSPSKCLMQRK